MNYKPKNYEGIEQPRTSPQTEEASDSCFRLQSECNRLLRIGLAYKSRNADRDYTALIQYTQNASNATIHRGYYCPSPVIDIIVGNVRRGKILRRPSNKSIITHQYCFDQSNRMCCIKRLNNNQHISTEFLHYDDNTILGVTVDLNGKLIAVSEEYYYEGKMQAYLYAEYCQPDQQMICFSFRIEQYRYDHEGLLECRVHTYVPITQTHNCEVYKFNRQDGYLKSYTVSKFDGNAKIDSYWDNHVFDIRIKRKAWPCRIENYTMT